MVAFQGGDTHNRASGRPIWACQDLRWTKMSQEIQNLSPGSRVQELVRSVITGTWENHPASQFSTEQTSPPTIQENAFCCNGRG